MKADAVQMMNVSRNTPNACTRPCSTGWLTAAVAAAFGTEPSPASLEKSPRLIPFITVAPNKPPPAATGSNAEAKIV